MNAAYINYQIILKPKTIKPSIKLCWFRFVNKLIQHPSKWNLKKNTKKKKIIYIWIWIASKFDGKYFQLTSTKIRLIRCWKCIHFHTIIYYLFLCVYYSPSLSTIFKNYKATDATNQKWIGILCVAITSERESWCVWWLFRAVFHKRFDRTQNIHDCQDIYMCIHVWYIWTFSCHLATNWFGYVQLWTLLVMQIDDFFLVLKSVNQLCF